MAPIAPIEAFERQVVVLPLANMLVLRPVDARTKRNRRYKRIALSIDEVGLVEPLVVCGKPDEEGRYLLLDGHLRRAALLDRRQSKARCLLARSDEAFTYNARINRVAIVQEHLMIVRALERGVPEDKLARALNVDVQHVRRRVGLLNGICREAVTVLADKAVNPVTFDVLRKMKPNRQREACDLMASASNFSSGYAKALLAGSKREDVKKAPKVERRPAITAADLSLLDREMSRMKRDFASVELGYGQDMLAVAITSNYLAKLIGNPRTARYLNDNHPEMFEKFRSIVSASSLDRLEESATGEATHTAVRRKRDRRSKWAAVVSMP